MTHESMSPTELIARYAHDELRLSAVGLAPAEAVPQEVWQAYQQTLTGDAYACLDYLQRYDDVRSDPRKLLPEAKSIIVVAQSYYPPVKQPLEAPQVAYYAYGRDYHKVVRKKLERLLAFIQSEVDQSATGRVCCDTAPLLERYWIMQSGLAYQGRSKMMIIPRLGTFFIYGFLVVSLPLEYGAAIDRSYCGHCQRCIDSCPGGALQADGTFLADRCLSYLTIEHRGVWPEGVAERLGNRLFGCDVCQTVCPHNAHCTPHDEPDFMIRPTIAQLTYEQLASFTPQLYETLTIGSSMRRCAYEDLLRNAQAVLANHTTPL